MLTGFLVFFLSPLFVFSDNSCLRSLVDSDRGALFLVRRTPSPTTMFRFVVALAALLAPAAAFAPRASRALTRRSGISMSHFSTVQTRLKIRNCW